MPGIILVIGVGGVVLAARHGAANHFTMHAMLSTTGVAKLYLQQVLALPPSPCSWARTRSRLHLRCGSH